MISRSLRKTWLLKSFVVTIMLISLLSSLVIGSAASMRSGSLDQQAYSVIERVTSILTGVDVFFDHPFIGAGFGVIRVHDTLVNLLANTGLVGFLLYIIANVGAVIKSCEYGAKDGSRLRMRGFGIILSYLWLCVAGALSGWPYIHPHYWLVLALLVGYTEYAKRVSLVKQESQIIDYVG